MEKEYEKINIDSQESFIDFIDNKWSYIQCQTNQHQTFLRKICIDPRCDKNTEQFHLICDKCLVELNSHQGGKDQHKTIELNQFLKQSLSRAFEVQRDSPQYEQKEEFPKEKDSKLKDKLPDLLKLKDPKKTKIDSIKYQQIQNVPKATSVQVDMDPHADIIKQLVYQVVQQNNLQSLQEKIFSLRQFFPLDHEQGQENQENSQDISELKLETEVLNETNQDKTRIIINNFGAQELGKKLGKCRQNRNKIILGVLFGIIIIYYFLHQFKSSQSRQDLSFILPKDENSQMKITFFQIISGIQKQNLTFDQKASLKEIKDYYWKSLEMPEIKDQTRSIAPEKLSAQSIQKLQTYSNKKFYPATFLLGLLYHQDIYLKQDNYKALALFQQANEQAGKQGCAIAMDYIGRSYLYGYGVDKDVEEGFKWENKSAELGFSIAQANVGYYYMKGIGTNKDLKLAFNYCQLSANQNYVYGQNSLGYCYDMGYGVKKDYVKAFEYYKLAADQGLDAAQYNVGIFLKDGLAGHQNIKQAKIYFQKAAYQGYESAIYELEKMNKQT